MSMSFLLLQKEAHQVREIRKHATSFVEVFPSEIVHALGVEGDLETLES